MSNVAMWIFSVCFIAVTLTACGKSEEKKTVIQQSTVDSKPAAPTHKGENMTNPERDQIIQSKLNLIGRESFPDDADVIWHLRGVVHKGDYSFVEAEPLPSTVGYPRFKFVLLFKQISDPILAGCYSLDKGQWSLLFTNPKVPSDWQSLQ